MARQTERELDVTATAIFVGAVLLTIAGRVLLAQRTRARRTAFIDGFDFRGLLDGRLAKRRPELDAAQRQRVFEGLREWFHISREAGRRRISMPSQAADDAWHEFILFTRNYQDFCRRALGRFLHHVPAEAMAHPTHAQEGIRRSWRLACRRAGVDPRQPTTLPRLFTLDAELGLADGFHYTLDCRRGAPTDAYCAAHIGCGSSGGDGSDADGDGGDGGGCGGD